MKEKNGLQFFRHLPVAMLLLISVPLFSQQKDFHYYDSLTYRLYQQKEWKSLLNLGREALNQGYDYYYLQMRMGIALYELRDYRAAIPSLQKALLQNSEDPVANGYLYYAFLESGRNEDAAMLAFTYRKSPDVIPGSAGGRLRYVYAEGGYTPSNSSGATAAELTGADSIYGEEDSYKSQSYAHLGVKIQIIPSLSVYLSGSRLGINKQRHFSYSTYGNTEKIVHDTVAPYSYGQQEFYAALTAVAAPGFTITPAFHRLTGNPSLVNCSYSNNAYSFAETSYAYKQNVVSLNITREMRRISLGLTGSVADPGTSGRQLQAAASLSWYPKGNLDIYTTSVLTGFRWKDDSRLIVSQTVGSRVAPKLWAEGNITFGNLAGVAENNAFVVYNQPERIKFRGTASLIFTLNRHIDLSVMYRYYSREYDYYSYRNDTGILRMETRTLSYTNQSIFGGFKWKL